ncbi:MAG: septum site-determining protein MinC [Methylococcales bacterium]|nr:septum site-determining protein MinC [Methylococcales bacterium]
MSTDSKLSIKKAALEIKSTSYSASVLALYTTSLRQIELLLDEKIALAPAFFKNSAVIVDLKECNHKSHTIDLELLIEILYKKHLMPVGICNGTTEQNVLALSYKIPKHTMRAALIQSTSVKITDKLPQPDEESIPEINNKQEKSGITTSDNMLLTQPVRSGQRVYAKGDLIVLNHVSPGAEIMAEGNIHVYGVLRGRALAGVQGNMNSRIFCTTLDAELISIAGNYKTSEDFNVKKKQAVQISLQDKSLIIETI